MHERWLADLLARQAPRDVRAAVEWLTGHGYVLAGHSGGSSFGAQLTFDGEAQVVITVDRGQWFLDVAAAPGAEPHQYDLLIPALAGKPYADVFPDARATAPDGELPEQLPPDVSWSETLPRVLAWIQGEGAAGAVADAGGQRTRLMWGGK
ncbi:hypothetical protein [Demequina rhizosphaerae]|uniref:hypothetical protein n=1 Tax=Demequina rhizosphaerae TaxID=1638985 RepID=UPI000782A74F|nr:hypothetical protein [Demequina rhizosphaerae]